MVVGSPTIRIYTTFKAFSDIFLFTALQVHDAKTIAVAFIAITFHALPSNVFAVWRERWVGVITHVAVCIIILLAEVGCILAVQIIKEDIRISRYSILQTSLLAASIGNAT